MQDCSAPEEGGAVRETLFFFTEVPEFDPMHDAGASDMAALLQAAVAWQEALVPALHAAMLQLDACSFALSTNSCWDRQPLTFGWVNSSRLILKKRVQKRPVPRCRHPEGWTWLASKHWLLILQQRSCWKLAEPNTYQHDVLQAATSLVHP